MLSLPAWPRKALVTMLALSALAALPAAGHAAQTFGSRLDHDPANSGECGSLTTPCTLVSYIHPSDPNGDPNSAGAPSTGVITKFRIRAFGEGDTPATVTFRLARISLTDPQNSDSALATAAGTGPTVTVEPDDGIDTPIREFPARLPVQQGDHLAIDGTNVWATVNNSGDEFSYLFAPPLVEGQGPRGSNSATGELLVQADIEPDADGDGFGDESQDQCPAQNATQGACDAAGPEVGDVRVAGRRIGYSLSEAATVTFRLEKAKKGRRVRGKCRRQTRRNRSRPRCSRYVPLPGSFTGSGAVGANERAVPARVGGRRVGPGRYRLSMTARDLFGNETQVTKRFRIR